jgi:hypothetical protein
MDPQPRAHGRGTVRTLAIALGACAALLPAACGGSSDESATDKPGARPIIGIGEQQAAMFTDKHFDELGIEHARLVVSYDAIDVDFERDLTDTWLKNAQQAGVEPFITFGHSRVHPNKLPSVAEFRRAFKAFRKRYPKVRVFAAWNEINHVSQPTHDQPKRAAEYYNVVKAACEGCTVLAGDVLDQPGMTRYVKRYRRHLEGAPRIWGLHNYADANRFRDSGLRDLLGAVKGDVWLTETGGIVRFGRSFPQDEQRAARAVKYVLALAKRTPRAQRVYLYNWTGTAPSDRFDAGLIAPGGGPRPAYDVLRAYLRG